MKKSAKIARELHAANFRLYGIGNFDISISELEEIIEVILSNSRQRSTLLKAIYAKFEQKRMG